MNINAKVINKIPKEQTSFQILICLKDEEVSLAFKLNHTLNDLLSSKKETNGIYCFNEHQDIFKWIFFKCEQQLDKTAWAFLLNHHPEIIENTFGVTVLPSKHISQKKWSEAFEKKYYGKYHELFPNELPEESNIDENFYEVQTSVNGLVLNTIEYFMVAKSEYHQYKLRHGKNTAFVITQTNQS